jgi:hypothetical protein
MNAFALAERVVQPDRHLEKGLGEALAEPEEPQANPTSASLPAHHKRVPAERALFCYPQAGERTVLLVLAVPVPQAHCMKGQRS